jgi:prepilin-type N-terminal cleavage/methylation domain-containing protein
MAHRLQIIERMTHAIRRGNTPLRGEHGFTLIELMIVVVIIGILAAIAVPNFVAMTNRAKEGSVKSNMHTLQLTAEDYGIQNEGIYAGTAGEVVGLIPSADTKFKNPFDNSVGTGNAWVDQATYSAATPSTGSTKRGISAYADSSNLKYQVMGRGTTSDLTLVLTGS